MCQRKILINFRPVKVATFYVLYSYLFTYFQEWSLNLIPGPISLRLLGAIAIAVRRLFLRRRGRRRSAAPLAPLPLGFGAVLRVHRFAAL